MSGLSVPDLPAGVTVPEAAVLYAACGWYVLPVDPATKHPGSLVGSRWEFQSTRDSGQVAAWWQRWPSASLALHTGRSGAAVVDGDAMARFPAVLRPLLGAMAFQSTDLADPARGHYAGACEPMQYGCALSGFPDGGRDWGEVKSGNSVIIVEPTPHIARKDGSTTGRYLWQRGRGVPLPPVPAGIAACLRPPGASHGAADTAGMLAFLAGLPRSDDQWCPRVAELLGPFPVGSGRYADMGHRVQKLVRLGEQGHLNVATALDLVETMLYAEVDANPNGWDPEDAWNQRMRTAVANVLADPTPPENKRCCGGNNDPVFGYGFTVPAARNGHAPASQVPAPQFVALPPSQAAAGGASLLGGMKDGAFLNTTTFRPLRFHAGGLVPQGLGLLVGAPKIGKSWLVLGWALEKAAAGLTVVYFALEDGDQGMQSRCRRLSPGGIPAGFRYLTDIAPGNLIPALREAMSLGGEDDPPLVILDTFGAALVSEPMVRGETDYAREYRIGRVLKAVADEYPGAALLLTHHNRKASAEDFVDTVSGTHGITGAADTILVLTRPRHEHEGQLQVVGRNIREGAFAMLHHDGQWSLHGGSLATASARVATARLTKNLGDTSAVIAGFVAERGAGGTRAGDVAVAFEMSKDDAGKYLRRLADAGRIRLSSRGVFTPLGTVPSRFGHLTLVEKPGEVSEVSEDRVMPGEMLPGDRTVPPGEVSEVSEAEPAGVEETQNKTKLYEHSISHTGGTPPVSDTSDTSPGASVRSTDGVSPGETRVSDTSDTSSLQTATPTAGGTYGYPAGGEWGGAPRPPRYPGPGYPTGAPARNPDIGPLAPLNPALTPEQEALIRKVTDRA